MALVHTKFWYGVLAGNGSWICGRAMIALFHSDNLDVVQAHLYSSIHIHSFRSCFSYHHCTATVSALGNTESSLGFKDALFIASSSCCCVKGVSRLWSNSP